MNANFVVKAGESSTYFSVNNYGGDSHSHPTINKSKQNFSLAIYREAVMKILKTEKGQALIEYTIVVGLIGLIMAVAIANVADQILDIWNDLAEDLDTIDDCVADLDVVCPESNEDNDYKDRRNKI